MLNEHSNKQEFIPVECVPSAAVAIIWGVFCLKEGVSAQRGVCWGGVSALGGLPGGGVSITQRQTLPGPRDRQNPPSTWTEFLTHVCD